MEETLRTKIQGKKLRVIIIYIVYYLTHTAWRVTFSPADLFGKCESICILLRIWSYLLKQTCGGGFSPCTMLNIISIDALVLVTKETAEHLPEL